ncbi:MAG: hypothetical protein ABIR18_05420 [Chitinophagaceae bacterium]
MKKNLSRLLPLICMLMLVISSCKKTSDYLTDTGIHNAVTPLSNYDYLAQNQFKQFDTLLKIVDAFDGLKDEVNKAGTFFAPTDYSIITVINNRARGKQLLNPAGTYTLDSLIKGMTIDSLRQYLFAETITLDNAREGQAQPFTSKGGTNQAVLKVLQTGAPYIDRTSAATYLLFFIKVRGALDTPGVPAPANESDITSLCQTSGIKTSNGTTTLHVLSNTHVFISF